MGTRMKVNFADINFKMLKRTLIFVGIVLAYFVLQLRFLNDAYFPSDEEDIMLGGKALAKGFLLYKDFLSQHMPVSYYISAAFELLGAHTIIMQRIYFYFFFAVMWTFIAFQYQDIVRKEVLLLFPICLMNVFSTYLFGTMVLSEHIAGTGFIILYLEYLKFVKKREINMFSCIMISISIILTFGTLFIAAFPVFVIGLAFFAQEIVWWKERKEKVKKFLGYLVKKYFKLVVIVALPWLVYFIYLKLTSTLWLFYYSAYKINRTIYPNYIGGYGGSIFGTVLGMVSNFARELQNLLMPSGGWTIASIVQLLVLVLAIIYIIDCFTKKGALLGYFHILFIFALGSRAYFHFHGTQCVNILCLFAVSVIVNLVIVDKASFRKRKLMYQSGVCVMILVLVMPYLCEVNRLASLSFVEEEDNTADMIAKITNEREAIWSATVSNDLFMKADRIGLYNILCVPWMLEAHSVRVLTEFGDTPPRVIAGLDRNYEVWGYKLTDYGKEVLEYIDARYTCYNDTTIYIRNDYYEEATEILEEAGL